MKEKDALKLSVVRMLKSALQLEKISKNHELSDEEVMQVVKKQVKQRLDTIEEYKKFNKEDKISELENEISILKSYLPEELSTDEMDKIIDETITESNASSIKDMGIVIKAVQAKVGARGDMSYISKTVKERLS
jgi:uncharacterized protein YqeY